MPEYQRHSECIQVMLTSNNDSLYNNSCPIPMITICQFNDFFFYVKTREGGISTIYEYSTSTFEGDILRPKYEVSLEQIELKNDQDRILK